LVSMIVLLLVGVFSASAQSRSSSRITITLEQGVVKAGVSGRLLVFMTSKKDAKLEVGWGKDPRALWIAAKEGGYLAPGESGELDPDEIAFPEHFSRAPAGDYRIRAVLDTNHNYSYTEEEDDGDLRSAITQVHLPSDHLALTLSDRVSGSELQTPHAEKLDFES